ncbi:hypothetical protein ACFE04_004243 [Oxalis oulophora]
MKNLITFFLLLTILLAITQLSSSNPSIAHHQDVDLDNTKHGHHTQSPCEVICDTLGKCSHKVAGAIGKAKEKVVETTHYRDRDAAVKCSYEKLKEKVAHDIKRTAYNMKETATKKAQNVKKENDNMKDIGKTLYGDIYRNTSNMKHSTENVTNMVIVKARELFNGTSPYTLNVVRYMISPKAFDDFMVLLNLVGFAVGYGMSMWVSFKSSYVLEGVLPRQQFVLVQSRIYPVYFRVLVCCVIATLVGHVYGRREGIFTDKGVIFQAYNLIASIVMVLVNLLVLEHRISKAMFERLKVEKEEGGSLNLHEDGLFPELDWVHDHNPTTTNNNNPTSDATTAETLPEKPNTTTEQREEAVRSRILENDHRMKRLNSFSSILNTLTLISLSWHLVYLSQRFRLNC